MARVYTSDPHFGHANMILLQRRSFLRGGDVVPGRNGGWRWASDEIKDKRRDEMDLVIMSNWNNVVGPSDDVYVLGDFSFADPFPYVRQLNGRIHLVLGNHDYKRKYKKRRHPFYEVQDVVNLNINQYERIFMAHYAHRVWPASHKGSYHLYGHSHDNLPPWGLSFDCGIDGHDLTPWTEEEVLERFRAMKEELKEKERDDADIIPGCKSKSSEDAFFRALPRPQDEGTGASGV